MGPRGFGHLAWYSFRTSYSTISKLLDPDCFGPEGPRNNLSNPLRSHNGKIHNTNVLWIALCGPKRIRTLRVQYTLSPVYFAITYKHAGKVFESSRKASHALLWVHAIKKDFLRKSLFYTRGPKRIRTPRLLSANEALYQMSYGPNFPATDAKQMYAL